MGDVESNHFHSQQQGSTRSEAIELSSSSRLRDLTNRCTPAATRRQGLHLSVQCFQARISKISANRTVRLSRNTKQWEDLSKPWQALQMRSNDEAPKSKSKPKISPISNQQIVRDPGGIPASLRLPSLMRQHHESGLRKCSMRIRLKHCYLA